MKKPAISVAALAFVLTVATPAHAVVATAVPGSYVAGWATPVIATPVGGTVTVANADIAPHQLIADGVFLPKKRAKKAPWCTDYLAKSCPLFWSEAVSIGENTQSRGFSS